MKNLVGFEVGEEGGTVWVEVEERAPAPGGGFKPASRGAEEGIASRARDTFDQALSTFRPAVRSIIRTLADLTPEELEITLGIKFSADARAFIAATGTEATIGVKIVWKKLPPEVPKSGS